MPTTTCRSSYSYHITLRTYDLSARATVTGANESMRALRVYILTDGASQRTYASAAFGRAGAFGARWYLHWHAIVSSRAVQSRASARSQALDATCVSRKRHQVHGDASFCAERKIPTNIAGIPDKVTVQSRRANAQVGQKRPFAGHGKH